MPATYQQGYTNAQVIPTYGQLTPEQRAVNIAPSLTLAKGTVLGELTATPGTYKAYAAANTDGSQVPKAILMYPVTTDALGNVTGIGDFGATYHTTPVYVSGEFKTTDLVGLDQNAVTVMVGRITDGTLANGHVRFA